jgi:hypothetical protein
LPRPSQQDQTQSTNGASIPTNRTAAAVQRICPSAFGPGEFGLV